MLLKSFHFVLFPCLQHQSCLRVALPLLYLCDHLRMTGPFVSRPGVWDVDPDCGPFFQAPPRLPEGAEAPELGSKHFQACFQFYHAERCHWDDDSGLQTSRAVLWEKYNPYDRFHVGYFWTLETSAQDSVGQKAGEPGPMGQEPLARVSCTLLSLPDSVFAADVLWAARVLTVFTSVFLSPGKDLTRVTGSPTHDVRRNSQRLAQICFLVLCWGCHFKEKLCLWVDEGIRAQIVNSISQASRSHQNPRHFRKHIFLRYICEQELWRRGIWGFVFLKQKNLAETPLILYAPWKTLCSS